jgi:P2-related tail formation protein
MRRRRRMVWVTAGDAGDAEVEVEAAVAVETCAGSEGAVRAVLELVSVLLLVLVLALVLR